MITYFSVVYLIVLPQIIQSSNDNIRLTKESTKRNPAPTNDECYSVTLLDGFVDGTRFSYKIDLNDDKDANNHRIEFQDNAKTGYDIDFDKYKAPSDPEDIVTENDGCSRIRSSDGTVVGEEATVLLVRNGESVEVFINGDSFDTFNVLSADYMKDHPNLRIYTKLKITTMWYSSAADPILNSTALERKTLKQKARLIEDSNATKLEVGRCMRGNTGSYTRLVHGFEDGKTLSIKAVDKFYIALTNGRELTTFSLYIDSAKKIASVGQSLHEKLSIKSYSINKQLPDRINECKSNNAFDLKILRADDDFVVYYNGHHLAHYSLMNIPKNYSNFNTSYFYIHRYYSNLKSVCYEDTSIGKFSRNRNDPSPSPSIDHNALRIGKTFSDDKIIMTKESMKRNPAPTNDEYYSVTLFDGFVDGTRFSYKIDLNDDKDANNLRIEFQDNAKTGYDIDFDQYIALIDPEDIVTEKDGCSRIRSSDGTVVGEEATVLLVRKGESIEVFINGDSFDTFNVSSADYMKDHPNLRIYTKSKITTMWYFSAADTILNSTAPERKTMKQKSRLIKNPYSMNLDVGTCMRERRVSYTRLVQGFEDGKMLSINAVDKFFIALTNGRELTRFTVNIESARKIASVGQSSHKNLSIKSRTFTTQLPDGIYGCKSNNAFNLKILREDDDFVVHYNGYNFARYSLMNIPKNYSNFNTSYLYIHYLSNLKLVCYEDLSIRNFNPNADVIMTKGSMEKNPAQANYKYLSVTLSGGFVDGMQFGYKIDLRDGRAALNHRIEFQDNAKIGCDIDFDRYKASIDPEDIVTEKDGCSRIRSSDGTVHREEATVLLVGKRESVEVFINGDLYDTFNVSSANYMQEQPNLRIYTKLKIRTMWYFSAANTTLNATAPEQKTLKRKSRLIRDSDSRKLEVGSCMRGKTKIFEEVNSTELVQGFENGKTLTIKASDKFHIALKNKRRFTTFFLSIDSAKMIATMGQRSHKNLSIENHSITKVLPRRTNECKSNNAFDLKILRADDDFVVYYNGYLLALYSLIRIPENYANFSTSYFYIRNQSNLKSICYEDTFVEKFNPTSMFDPDCSNKLANQNMFRIPVTEFTTGFLEGDSLSIYTMPSLFSKGFWVELFYEDLTLAMMIGFSLSEFTEKDENNVYITQEVPVVLSRNHSVLMRSKNGGNLRAGLNFDDNKPVKYFSLQGDAQLIGICQSSDIKPF